MRQWKLSRQKPICRSVTFPFDSANAYLGIWCCVQLDSSYLTTKTDRDEVERRCDFANCKDHFRDDWRRLLSGMQEGDELWNFAPSNKTHHEFWGVALVRSGQVIATLLEAVG
jgi:hypothetical protein